MLSLEISDREVFDQEQEIFRPVNPVTLQFEHSLVSLSKWESKYEKPFLSDKQKTNEEVRDYIGMMLLTPDAPSDFVSKLSTAQMNVLTDYISSKQTATWFKDSTNQRKSSQEVITAEVIYYWMVSLEIPFECQYWHLNRLMTLIKVINRKNAPKKKMSTADNIAQRRALNEARRKKYNTKG